MFISPRIPEETLARYKMLYESGIIVEHCNVGGRIRHGTILNIKKQHVNEIYSMLVYYFGQKCGWTKKNPDGTTSIEFIYQGSGKVIRPWYYCGTTVLFKENQVAEDANNEKMAQFHLDDEVVFEFRGRVIRGHIANLRKRATVVSGGTKYYVPANQLRKVER